MRDREKLLRLNLYQIDAFTDRIFSGNPAAVCPLEYWLNDDVLQSIAEENNLSETAFFCPEGDAFRLRWFTPNAEVDLCGHATLAAAHVLYQHLHYQKPAVTFLTRSGVLQVEPSQHGYTMEFPASIPRPIVAPQTLFQGLSIQPKPVLAAADYVVILDSEEDVRRINPDFQTLATLDRRGVIVTAPGEQMDFVSRCFYPKLRVNEDPVTGSAHCQLAPYWSSRLNKRVLSAEQLSVRGGKLRCVFARDVPNAEPFRVQLIGSAVDYLHGIIHLSN